MNEVFPILGSVVLGLVTQASFGLGVGAAASWVSGELALSYAYILVEAGQVVIASIIATALVSLWDRRRSRPLAR